MTANPSAAFSPFSALAEKLLPHAMGPVADKADGAHDIAHLIRVFRNATRIQAIEGGDGRILAAAVMLHDCVAVEKNSPLRSQASRLAADKASEVLRHEQWSDADIAATAHAIEAHSFSANIEPRSLEAMILQDADRLDAIGMLGAARCFYIAGRMGSALYDPFDPRGRDRPLDDRTFAIDHFEVKLFKLADGFRTAEGRRLAQLRQARLRSILDQFLEEIEG